MSRTSHRPGRDRRLRQRLFDAGNNRYPICLSEFDRLDVVAGTEVTLEHAPPKSLGGFPICLTCKSCNSKTSLIDQHAFLSAKARSEWAEGRGAPIVINLFGHKRSYRFIPQDSNAPFPARKHLFRNGTIELGPLPTKAHLDANKGISFSIPQRDDFEFVSMIKSAYLMVFSLLGANGYKFAENIGLQPVREQIMNPEKKILKGGFIGTVRIDSDDFRKLDRSIVFLCRTEPYPFWIVPMRNDKAVFLSCGGTEPIDKLVMNPKEADIPFGSLVGWVSRRFNSSSAIGGTVGEGHNDSHDSLGGTVGGPFPTSMGAWLFVMVFHQMKDYVALPFCPEDGLPASDAINVVDMLSEQETVGRSLDRTQLATTNFGSWAKDFPITRRPMGGERSQKEESDT